MRFVDLTRKLEIVDKGNFPQQLMPLYRIISPEIEYIDHAAGAKIMQQIFQCQESDLPAGEGWAEENIQISSHLGTHVDAPWHYGSTSGEKEAMTVDEIPLEDLFCDTFVLDFSRKKGSGAAITASELQAELERINYKIKEGDACLIRTDHDKYALNDPIRYNYPGLIAESAKWLSDQGVKVGGTDGTGWDRPFHIMVAEWMQTRNKEKIWDAHYAHRASDFYVVQQLCNLDKLPPHGFKTAFFPIPLAKASAAPARVVAFLPN